MYMMKLMDAAICRGRLTTPSICSMCAYNCRARTGPVHRSNESSSVVSLGGARFTSLPLGHKTLNDVRQRYKRYKLHRCATINSSYS